VKTYMGNVFYQVCNQCPPRLNLGRLLLLEAIKLSGSNVFVVGNEFHHGATRVPAHGAGREHRENLFLNSVKSVTQW